MTHPVGTPHNESDPAPPLVLAGRYVVFEVLGRGGMAAVHRGQDERLDRPVAIKILHAHLAHDERVLDRFRREAVAAAALNHPGVVAVYDHWKGGDEDPPFLVMELVEGGSVRDVLDVRGTLTPGQTLALLRPAAVGLAAAHAEGLVHRDVTPANILVGSDGAAKLGDFGLARAAAASTSTFPEGVVGSPHYMSPESVRGESLDARADVYSLGCVLYECLVGRPPFSGDSPTAIALQHGATDLPAPSSQVPQLPRRLDEVVARATAADPDDRFQDAAAFVVALDEAVPEGPEAIDLRTGSAHLRIDPVHATTMLDDDPMTIAMRADATTRRRVPMIVGAVLAAVLLAIGGYVSWDRLIAPVTDVPPIAGTPLELARDTLGEAGFDVAVADERPFDRDVPAGAVVSATPDESARRGATIDLVVSSGPRTGELPVMTGRTAGDARAAVRELGLDLTVRTVDGFDDEAAVGIVIASTPVAGARIEEGGEVQLTVSAGPAPVDVPELRGEGQTDATATLAELGLTATVAARRHDDDVPLGSVIATRPETGTTLKRGDEVGLVVSDGPAPVEVPDVRRLGEEEAVAQLEELGFLVEVEYVPRILPLNLGRVDEQAPSPGQERVRGSTIRLFVWTLA